jgi:IS30 family transposase
VATKGRMTIEERYKYLGLMQERYWAGGRSERSRLLNEMEEVTRLHRKSLIRLMRGGVERKRRRRQRGRTYGAEVDDALRVISESMDHICAERLQPNLVWIAKHLAQHGEMMVNKRLLDQLGTISVSSVRRILERVRQDQPRLVRKRPTQRRSYQHIPARRLAWDLKEPGHFEVDLVHHCGETTSGQYVCTLQMVDIATGWSERVAILGRSYLVMQDAFERVLKRLPFAVRELHPDNGGEFLNHHLLRYWPHAMPGVELSRSRTYQKNDNRFVEQKNGSLVRTYLGQERLDTVAHTEALNRFYDGMWLYYNCFQPVMRLSAKEFLPSTNGIPHVRRHFDDARPPVDRLLDTKTLSTKQAAELKVLRRDTNPRQLLRELYHLRDALLELPLATPDQTEDVRQTLQNQNLQ